MKPVTVQEAAASLGVTPREVRRLIQQGDLPAVRFGATLVVSSRDVARRQREAVSPGRIWAPQTAWAALDLLQGGAADGMLDQPRRSRLRSRLRGLDGAQIHRLAGRRARIHRFHASPRALALVRGELVPAGASALADEASAASRFGLTPASSASSADGYFRGDLSGLVSALRLVPDSSGQTVIRHLAEGLILPREFGDAVIAVDLMDSDDPREREGGRSMLDELVARV